MKAFFVSIPHSGEKVPADASWLHGLPEPVLMCDVDRYVDQLYQPAIKTVGCPVVMAEWHRYVVDLNRLPDDVDVDSVIGAPNPSGTYPRGMHWIHTTIQQTLMPQPITMELHQQLVDKYFEPFHTQVRSVYDSFRAKGFQKIYHLDAHSMPSMGTKAHKDPGQRRADIVVSDCEGKSCESFYRDLVVDAYKRAGFHVAVNWPYVGGRVTETYGHPSKGQHAIQVELNRALYMNEETKKLKPELADGVSPKITQALADIPKEFAGHPMIERIIKFFASLRLAVFVILSIAAVAGTGTIIEAKYNDADAASQLVYRSPYMYAVLGLLCINLTAVMIDRWPWKKRHVGFVMVHIGIILTLFGAWVTQHEGLDGTLVFAPGQAQKYVTVKKTDLAVYATLDGSDVRPMYESEVNFRINPPKEHPLEIPVGSDTLEVVDYYPYAFRQSEIQPSESPMDGPAARFQLVNDRVNLTEWLRRDARKAYETLDLGPAKVILSDGSYKPENGQNEIVISPGPLPALHYAIYSHGLLSKRGLVRQSDTIETGWMGLQFRLLRFLPRAREKISYIQTDHNTEDTESAILLKFRGESSWIGLNSLLRLYSSDRMYIISYGHRRIPLDFSLTLKDFKVGHYQGTERASSYASDVEVPGRGLVHISMNEPLKYQGFTFYQASFEQDPSGKPTASVLSVNHDPGRWIKYIGCLMVVLGSAILFWFRKLFQSSPKSRRVSD